MSEEGLPALALQSGSLPGLLFKGPKFEGGSDLPQDLVDLLSEVNGFVVFEGGFHLRGQCSLPDWHSLAVAQRGALSLVELYPESVLPGDVPFGEDAVGDQYLLRAGKVGRLDAETGDVELFDWSLREFLSELSSRAASILPSRVMNEFSARGERLQPGQVILVMPPLVVKAEQRVMRAGSALPRRQFLATVARQIRDVPDGTPIRFVVKE